MDTEEVGCGLCVCFVFVARVGVQHLVQTRARARMRTFLFFLCTDIRFFPFLAVVTTCELLVCTQTVVFAAWYIPYILEYKARSKKKKKTHTRTHHTPNLLASHQSTPTASLCGCYFFFLMFSGGGRVRFAAPSVLPEQHHEHPGAAGGAGQDVVPQLRLLVVGDCVRHVSLSDHRELQSWRRHHQPLR